MHCICVSLYCNHCHPPFSLVLVFFCQELASGEPVLVDLNEESDGEEQDFDSWQPDPVDADPSEYEQCMMGLCS